MYLWHFPLDIALTGSRTGLTGHTALPVPHRGDGGGEHAVVLRPGATHTDRHDPHCGPGPHRHTGRGDRHRGPRRPDHGPAARLGRVSPRPTAPVSLPGGCWSHGAPRLGQRTGPGDAGGRLGGLVTRGRACAPEQLEWHIDQENLAILGCGVAQGGAVWDVDPGQQRRESLSAYPCRARPAATATSRGRRRGRTGSRGPPQRGRAAGGPLGGGGPVSTRATAPTSSTRASPPT